MEVEKIDEIKKSIRKINPYSAIIETNYCEVDINYVLDTNLFDSDSSDSKGHTHDHDDHSHEHNHDHTHASHGHTHDKKQIEKYFFKTEVPCFHIENIKNFLAEISEDIFRMK